MGSVGGIAGTIEEVAGEHTRNLDLPPPELVDPNPPKPVLWLLFVEPNPPPNPPPNDILDS
jgi:hypothetical protein